MLVKLAFVMQRLKIYLKKNFVMIDKHGGGGTAVMRGDIELMGGPPSPPTRENPDILICTRHCVEYDFRD